ncbi:hypothetical protein SAMN05216302_101148 [Nitrosomonas aestuarii]|uniref:Uncharacterized protein n=1 Tax=Nitrosomonas aestuarii TaxID=52441 RepID=A0A1I4B848_9PROT|nr:hypothetical protein [Nitrosomonas aestuarii]SFK64139.1 hypothetical protein SAMN05216302_101148 [Nitrosomonas aestuarii]
MWWPFKIKKDDDAFYCVKFKEDVTAEECQRIAEELCVRHYLVSADYVKKLPALMQRHFKIIPKSEEVFVKQDFAIFLQAGKSPANEERYVVIPHEKIDQVIEFLLKHKKVAGKHNKNNIS